MAFSKQNATQSFIPIKDVQEGIITLEDNSLRVILMVSTLNIALKSEDERAAILMQFQSFLNTLDFSVQIFMQSRELDIRPYIQTLQEQHKKQENELLRIQISEYIDFINDYTENVNIMTKAFFVVVPYYPPMVKSKKISPFGFSGKKDAKPVEKESLKDRSTQLQQRVTIVSQGLRRTGLRTVSLQDEEIKELFYNLFNPGEERTALVR
ncbi:MAG: TraC family protein [Patescibacteria group bacterium]